MTTTLHAIHYSNNLTHIAIAIGALAMAWIAAKTIDRLVPLVSKFGPGRIDSAASNDRVLRWRRVETFAGAAGAVVRVVLVAAAIMIAWHEIQPNATPFTLIGAGAAVALVAGSIIGPLFRDITLGSMMIAEGWYNVGDHITVVPFNDVRGVVEQLTPRSTKIRSLNGEVIWMHNQNIMGARVTSRGVRTIALDVFVNDEQAGKQIVRQAIRSVPTGPTMLAGALKMTDAEQLGEGLWRLSAVGQTMAGREWLIEDFAVSAIKKCDALRDGDPVIVHGPIAHHADAAAERRFRRSLRAHA